MLRRKFSFDGCCMSFSNVRVCATAHRSTLRSGLWVGCSKEPLSSLSSKVVILFIPADQIMLVDGTTPSALEISGWVGFLERHETNRPDGFSYAFFKDGSEVQK